MRRTSKKQQKIKDRLNKVYHLIDTTREPVCQGCGRGDRPLSHSHTISQKRCKEIGKPELISDENNIELECFGNSKYCHETWEGGSITVRKKMKNFDRKMDYIKIHDVEKYTILSLAIEST